jgi:hypothetical protein
MKKITIILIVTLLVNVSYAQELLYFANGNLLKITNYEQSADSVSFKIHNSTEDNTYYINKDDLVKMITESGEIIEFSGKYSKSSSKDFTSNIISFNTLAVPAGRFTMTYQFLNKTGTLGYEIPISIGLLSDGYTDPLPEIFDIEFYSVFYTGFTLNWYPLGQNKISYVLGPSFRIGVGEEEYWDNYNHYDYQVIQAYYSKLLINNGIVLMPSQHFSMAFILSFGIMHRTDIPQGNFGTTGDFTFNLSYRF